MLVKVSKELVEEIKAQIIAAESAEREAGKKVKFYMGMLDGVRVLLNRLSTQENTVSASREAKSNKSGISPKKSNRRSKKSSR